MRLVLRLLLCCTAWAAEPVEVRIVYDNTPASPGLEKDWGFAALVSRGAARILFDSGTRPDIFMRNLAALEIDPSSLEQVFISHRHPDHTGGLAPLQAKNPRLKLHWPDPTEPYEILPGFRSTGALPGAAREQALVIDTPKGLVVITGCSHPGVVNLVEAAVRQHGGKPVRYLTGGFHMLQDPPEKIEAAIAALKKLRVERISPTHCTGEPAAKMFRDAFGARFEPAGAGKMIRLE